MRDNEKDNFKASDLSDVKKLIDWILSPQGQLLIEKTGYTPID